LRSHEPVSREPFDKKEHIAIHKAGALRLRISLLQKKEESENNTQNPKMETSRASLNLLTAS
jgi:hypothetical protein